VFCGFKITLLRIDWSFVHLVREFFIFLMALMIAKAILLYAQKKRTKEKGTNKANPKFSLHTTSPASLRKFTVRTFSSRVSLFFNGVHEC
jgi:hypothetical protein